MVEGDEQNRNRARGCRDSPQVCSLWPRSPAVVGSTGPRVEELRPPLVGVRSGPYWSPPPDERMNPNAASVDYHHCARRSRPLSHAQRLALVIVDAAARHPCQVAAGRARRRAPLRSHSTVACPPIGGRACRLGGTRGRCPPFASGSAASLTRSLGVPRRSGEEMSD
jgi:hypothetical protein